MSALLARLPEKPDAEGESGDGLDLWDVDAAVSNHCAEKGIPLPATPEGRTRLHREAIGEWLDSLEKQLPAPA